MAPGGGRVIQDKSGRTVKVITQKLVLAVVELYKSDDEYTKKLAIDLAGSILESYEDIELFRNDILGVYVSSGMLDTKISAMRRIHPEISKTLSEIFGVVLFGGD